MNNNIHERRITNPTHRKTNKLPAEKLLEILRGIYPKEQAEEIFRNLQSKEAEE